MSGPRLAGAWDPGLAGSAAPLSRQRRSQHLQGNLGRAGHEALRTLGGSLISNPVTHGAIKFTINV